MGNEFEVKVEDLTEGSHALVDIECGGCGKDIKNIEWRSYKKFLHNGEYYCNKCAKNEYEKSNNFEEWCYETLTKDKADKLLSRWCYELNIDKNGKILNPKDISRGTNEKYWFKCLNNSKHIPEQKDIHRHIGNGDFDFECFQCKTIATTHPYLIKFLVNKEDIFKYSHGSKMKIPMKCPDCGYEKKIGIQTFLTQGLGCNKCSDGIPYPEKFMFNVLEQLKDLDKIQNFEKEKTFKWLLYKFKNKFHKGYMDFYFELNNQKYVIEMDGSFHSTDNKMNGRTKEENKYIDDEKDRLCKEHDIKVIRIDCLESYLEYIKDNIVKSELPSLLNFKEENIDWLKAHKAGCSNIVKKACKLWHDGMENTSRIAEELRIHKTTVARYLKQGAKLGWCNYDVEIERRKGTIAMRGKNNRQTICLTTMEIFNSTAEAARTYNILAPDIFQCCKNIKKYAGEYKNTGEKMVWMYYDEYIEKDIKEIKEKLLKANASRIICLTTNEIFNSQKEAERKYNLCNTSIFNCCRNKSKSAGKHPETGEKLVWMYYEEYLRIHT
jgi:hypothetical protein